MKRWRMSRLQSLRKDKKFINDFLLSFGIEIEKYLNNIEYPIPSLYFIHDENEVIRKIRTDIENILTNKVNQYKHIILLPKKEDLDGDEIVSYNSNFNNEYKFNFKKVLHLVINIKIPFVNNIEYFVMSFYYGNHNIFNRLIFAIMLYSRIMLEIIRNYWIYIKYSFIDHLKK